MQFSFVSLIIISFVGGILSVASPCSGLMLPMFFANTFTKKSNFFKHSLFFSLGALVIALPLGLSLSYLIFALNTNLNFIFAIMGVVFIIFGFLSILGLSHKFSIKINSSFNNSFLSSFTLGVVSALSLGTCTGPILGLIVTLSANSFSLFSSSVLMFFYVLGIVAPFILIGLSVDKFKKLKKLLVVGKVFKVTINKKTILIHSTSLISGVLFIIIGIIFIFFNASSDKVFYLFRINFDNVLTLQDKLIEFFIN